MATATAGPGPSPSGRTLRIETARAFLPFLRPARYKGAKGGRGSAKSWHFADNAIERCVYVPGTRVVCIREVQKSLEQSVKRVLDDRIRHYGLVRRAQDGPEAGFRILDARIETPGGGVMIFQGMNQQTEDSIKSLEGFDIAWVEEAQTLSESSLRVLRPTIRKPGSELWFTWNPRFPSDPVDKFLTGKGAPRNAIVRHVTWEDNPWFPDVLREEAEFDRRRDPEMYEHVWGGGYEVHNDAQVFRHGRHWRVEEFDTPSDAAFLFGSDFGFAASPTTLIRFYITGVDAPGVRRKLWIDREAYKVGCEIDDTPELYDSIDPENRGMARNWEIVGDSARPETISYLQRHGYPRVVGAKKGPNSVEEGVKFLKGFDIIVHPRCTHTQRELTRYSYKRHPQTEEVMPVLADAENHIIDPLRYGTEKVRQPGPVAEVL